VRQREFITLLGGAAAASPLLWPLVARTQQPAGPGSLEAKRVRGDHDHN